ncbi:glycosyltransferase [Lentibacillus sp. CBA3610]|uniref:glycosyltransferase n=1 Tax=Lentibacillus sp. CBA3610 TaxID=2518176 RepID=UPI00350E4C96
MPDCRFCAPISRSGKNSWETYECGLAVDPYDETQIKEAIDYLRNNPDEAKRMGENGKAAVMDKLNWHTEEAKLVAWYDQLTAEN